jgi:hypothetical protein
MEVVGVIAFVSFSVIMFVLFSNSLFDWGWKARRLLHSFGVHKWSRWDRIFVDGKEKWFRFCRICKRLMYK